MNKINYSNRCTSLENTDLNAVISYVCKGQMEWHSHCGCNGCLDTPKNSGWGVQHPTVLVCLVTGSWLQTVQLVYSGHFIVYKNSEKGSEGGWMYTPSFWDMGAPQSKVEVKWSLCLYDSSCDVSQSVSQSVSEWVNECGRVFVWCNVTMHQDVNG